MNDTTYHDVPMADHLRELAEPACPDRGAKLQLLCTQIWNMLERSPVEAGDIINDFIALLQDPEHLSLARLVIPELRPEADPPQYPLQEKVVQGTARARSALRAQESTQDNYDRKQPLYAAEKRIFQAAEMYRASILLFNSGSLSPEETEQVKTWIEACPVKKTAEEQ